MANGGFMDQVKQAVNVIQPLVQELKTTLDTLNQVKNTSIWSIESQLDQAEAELGKAVQVASQIREQVNKAIGEALKEQEKYNMYGLLGGLAGGLLVSLLIIKK